MLMAVAVLFSAATVFAAHTNPISDTTKTKKGKTCQSSLYLPDAHRCDRLQTW